MTESRSAKLQRAFRERMRRQGLVSKLVYIRPEHSGLLSRIERALRQPQHAQVLIKDNDKGDSRNMSTRKWTTPSLFEALKSSELVYGGQASIELIEGVESAINLTMHEYGDLPIQITASGEQLFCATTMWEASKVKDPAAFNELLLLVNPVNPLSNFGLTQLPDGRKVYVVFGELSTASDLGCVIEEVDMLVRNALEAAEGFADQLIQ